MKRRLGKREITGAAVRWYEGKGMFRVAVALTVMAAVLGVLFAGRPANDVAGCYARQVREFAAGNWPAAFFHMSPPLVIVLAGLLAKLAVPPFAALKIMSGAFFVAGLWPLRRLLQRALAPKHVAWGCLLYAVCPRLIRYATMGTLDSAKAFFLLWLAVALLEYSESRRWKPLLLGAVAAACFALARPEAVFFLPLFLVCLWGLSFSASRWLRRPLGVWRTVRDTGVFVLVAGLLCLPQVLYVQKACGYPALDSRQATVIQRALAAAGLGHPPSLPPAPTAGLQPRADILPEDVHSFGRNIRETIKGLDNVLLCLALIGIVPLLRRRGWGRTDTVCLAIILYNIALFLANGFVTKRYITPTTPFLLAWSVAGIVVLKTRVLDRLHRRLFAVVAVVFIVISVGDGLSRARPAWPPKRDQARELGRWLAAHRQEPVKTRPVALVSNPVWILDEYHDGRQPIVACTKPQYAFWAEADWVSIGGDVVYPCERLVQRLQERQVDLLIADADFLLSCPEFNPGDARFAKVAGIPSSVNCEVYRVLPKSPTKAE